VYRFEWIRNDAAGCQLEVEIHTAGEDRFHLSGLPIRVASAKIVEQRLAYVMLNRDFVLARVETFTAVKSSGHDVGLAHGLITREVGLSGVPELFQEDMPDAAESERVHDIHT
jgi:hypothetical protein